MVVERTAFCYAFTLILVRLRETKEARIEDIKIGIET
jgi:hypothetical protein